MRERLGLSHENPSTINLVKSFLPLILSNHCETHLVQCFFLSLLQNGKLLRNIRSHGAAVVCLTWQEEDQSSEVRSFAYPFFLFSSNLKFSSSGDSSVAV